MSKKLPTAPSHLRKETADWFTSVVKTWELEPHHLRLLQLAAEAWDRCNEAREALAEHGLTYTDGNGKPYSRPEVAVERDSRLAFARLLRELQLDVEAPPSVNDARPPRLTGNAHLRVMGR